MMRDKKRTYEVQVLGSEPSLIQPGKAGSKKDDASSTTGQPKQDSQFSRELILRLIEWIKQI